ncbi:MAG: hypothetical protein SFU86_00065 [Pirellulaceae bacterium]|nr:hypothetical protein [Pirellulaceae bacterium]
MPAEEIDKDLLEGLRQARKRAQHFVLICKGNDPLKLLVDRKRPRDGELRLVRSDVGGNRLIRGVVEGDGGVLVFFVQDEEPKVKPARLREMVAQQTEIMIRPEYKVVAKLPEVR